MVGAMTLPRDTHRRAGGGGRPVGNGPGAPVRREPVKGVGRHTDRHYCERCGQKVRACACPKP